jgi:hypothetical protein
MGRMAVMRNMIICLVDVLYDIPNPLELRLGHLRRRGQRGPEPFLRFLLALALVSPGRDLVI